MLLEKKSCVECDEDEFEGHNFEIQLLLDNLAKYIKDLPCVFLIEGEPFLEEQFSLYECLDIIQYFDIKNGIDLEIGDNNIFQILCYGNDFNHPTVISVLPYDENRDFLDISAILKNIFENVIKNLSSLN